MSAGGPKRVIHIIVFIGELTFFCAKPPNAKANLPRVALQLTKPTVSPVTFGRCWAISRDTARPSHVRLTRWGILRAARTSQKSMRHHPQLRSAMSEYAVAPI